ncbi:MAG: tetratricopeptide repeat protein [Opitutae bacterium]|nr:tetratricopeptide repeat protein [Opitutae bacterium]
MNRPRSSASPSAPEAPAREWPLGAIFALCLLATFVAYLPSLRGDFLWDDAGHVTSPALQSWSGLLRVWFEPGVTQQYYPVLHSAFWLEHALWGDATLGYHLVNVLWHALSACLFVALLRRLAVPGATLAGLLFALHPVCVESVAWISEQKNTLSLVFLLAAALAWLRFEDARSAVAQASRLPSGPQRAKRLRSYALATALFVLSLLTKSVTATLPAALLVLAWWRRGRVSWRDDVRPLLPWFAAGIAAGLFTAWFERAGIGAQGAEFHLGPIERGLLAARIFWFYLGKLVWPAELIFFYPRWQIDAAAAAPWLFPVAALALLGALAWWSRRGRGRGLPAAFLLFGGMLFPALGFVNVYPFVFSYVADHFQYHASLAMIALLGALAVRGWERLSAPRWSGPVAATALLAFAGALTWQQSATYRDVFALYESTLARNPDSWVAQLNLGVALDDAGRTDEALPHLLRSNELKPDHPDTLNTLGNVLNRLGRPAEARPLLERAVQLQPRFASAHNTLGVSLMALGQADAGLAAFRRALEIEPQFVVARVNFGWALANSGRTSEALVQLELARRAAPADANAELKTALVYAVARRPNEALPHARRAVELQPDSPDAHHILGSLLLELGRVADAGDEFEAALELAPAHPGAQQGLEQVRRLLPRR